jgi:hypothetical protein
VLCRSKTPDEVGFNIGEATENPEPSPEVQSQRLKWLLRSIWLLCRIVAALQLRYNKNHRVFHIWYQYIVEPRGTGFYQSVETDRRSRVLS